MRTLKAPKLSKELLPPFNAAEVHDLLEACEFARDTALLLTLLDSGVRAMELLNLNVGDVDLVTGAVKARRGKGQKDRTTFIGPRTRKAIARYLLERPAAQADDPFFVTLDTGTRLTFFGLASMLRRIGLAAAVRPTGAHRFRRTLRVLQNAVGVAGLALGECLIVRRQQF